LQTLHAETSIALNGGDALAHEWLPGVAVERDSARAFVGRPMTASPERVMRSLALQPPILLPRVRFAYPG